MKVVGIRKIVMAMLSRTVLLTLLVAMEIIHMLVTLRNCLGSIKLVRRSEQKMIDILVIGTFHNSGWLDGHIRPLASAVSIGTVTVLSDFDHPSIDGIHFRSPPKKLQRTVGRFLSRTIWLVKLCYQSCPDVIVGYHIMPNALLASVVSRIFRVKMIYQMTSGPVQIVGGGNRCSNRIQAALTYPSISIEKLLHRSVRRFDSVIVRGEKAKIYVSQNRLSKNCEIVTAGIDTDQFRPQNIDREIDLICVSRLVPNKGLEELLEIATLIRASNPQLRVVIVGDGPLRSCLERRISETDLNECVVLSGKRSNVECYLGKSRAFILLSKSEGLSIAMLEAMSVGLPVIVTDVGDLRDFVSDSVSGYLVELPVDMRRVAKCVSNLIVDETEQNRIGRNARAEVFQRASLEIVAGNWDRIIAKLLA